MKQSRIQSLLLVLLSFFILGFVLVNNQENRLIEVANEYQTYSQDVNFDKVKIDSSKYKWTISLCAYLGEDRNTYHQKVDSTFFSNADTAISPHGNKLYKLFVKDQDSYDLISSIQPIGQTLVKETWNVEIVEKDSLKLYSDAILSKNDNNWYRPTSVSQLFIMYKEESSDLNDNGWVYGIVDKENNSAPKVLSKGNISSCISCHKDTKYDRLFGTK